MALSNNIDICNLALDHLGKGSIVSFTENSPEAQRCRRQYDPCRRLALSRSPWTFARKTANLALLPTSALSQWAYCYDLPNDMRKLHKLLADGENPHDNVRPHPQYVEGGKLYTNIENARLVYVEDSTDVPSWSAEFDDALSYLLAWRMAPGMTRRKADVTDMKALYDDAIMHAIEIDAQQESTTYRYGDGYADSRIGGSESGARQADGSNIWGS